MGSRWFLMLGAMLGVGAFAQNPTSFAVAARVESIDSQTISVKSEAGAVETFRLSPALLVVQNRPATLYDIKPNDFIASAAIRREDGRLHSTELRIFPEAMRGVGDGQRPMSDPRHQMMTNATVIGTAIIAGSNTIRVRFAGGESELVLDPGIPVVAIVAVDRSLVTPGAKVRVQGTRNPDGALIHRITLL